jgi:hypothetical protein
MSSRCTECGAPLPQGGSCREHFDTLLAREWQIRGGPGALPHFFAVATWGLQHPRAMSYTMGTVSGLRRAVADALNGDASIEELRRRAGAGAAKAGRITRTEGDAEVDWQIAAWPMTVVDVLTVMTARDNRQARARHDRAESPARRCRGDLSATAAESPHTRA